jgi:hypothetical protein
MVIWQVVLGRYDATLTDEFYADQCAGVPTSQTAELFVEKFRLRLTPTELIKVKREAEGLRLANTPYPLMPFARYAIPHALSKGQDFSRATAVFKDFEEASRKLSH